MISLDLIAKVMSAPLGIFSGDLKECPTLVRFVLQNTNYVCESLDNAFIFLNMNCMCRRVHLILSNFYSLKNFSILNELLVYFSKNPAAFPLISIKLFIEQNNFIY